MKKKLLAMMLILCCLAFAACNDESPISTQRGVLYDDTLAPIAVPVSPDGEARIRFVAVGDNIAHDDVVDTARADAERGEEYDFSKIYAGVEHTIKAADIAFINQEAPVGGKELGISGYPDFNAPDEMVEELIEVGFDVFNIANNHMLDKGEKGYVNTIEYFASLPVTMIGGYTKNDYDNIRIINNQGVRIAFLSYTTLVNYAHMGDVSQSSDYIIPYADTDDITRQVGIAKQNADVVIVSFHWGTEDEFGVTAEQSKYANLCADLGVDVILGHHPHVVGDVEYITGESGNKTLVAYSLGNFCSTMMYGRNMVGELLSFDIVKDTDGRISIDNVIVDPIVCHYKRNTKSYDVRLYFMKDYNSELAEAHGSHVWGDTFTFSQLKKYVTDTVSTEFLPSYMK